MMFYGRESPECKEMNKLLDRLEEEEGIEVKCLEVWHDSSNQSLMMKYAEERCIGVPFLFNSDTGDYICGESSYKRVKEWAKEEETGSEVSG